MFDKMLGKALTSSSPGQYHDTLYNPFHTSAQRLLETHVLGLSFIALTERMKICETVH